MKTRLLFLAVFTPLGVLGRPLWRRRLDLGFSQAASTYWHDRREGPVTADDLRRRA